MRVKSSIEIQNSPEQVFEFLLDGHKTGTYFAREFEIKPVLRHPSPDGRYRLGTLVNGKGTFFGLSVGILYKVVDFKPEQVVRLLSQGGNYDSEVIWQLNSTNLNHTNISLELALAHRPGLFGLFTNMALNPLEPILHGYLHGSLFRLKKILENPAYQAA
jgi:hypothetical protein